MYNAMQVTCVIYTHVHVQVYMLKYMHIAYLEMGQIQSYAYMHFHVSKSV